MNFVRIIPEEHRWDKNFETRVDYVEECKSYASRVLTMLEKQKELLDPEQDKLIVIYMGDINHREFSTLDAFLYWLQYFIRLNEICDGNVYSVMGNHEVTYARNNLFWMLADIQSPWVLENTKHVNKFNLLAPLIKVVDDLVLDDTMFLMGHYNRDMSSYSDKTIPPDIKNVILLSHNQILNSTIATHFKENCNRDMIPQHIRYESLEKTGILPRTSRLRHVYVGHMHKAYGKFEYESIVEGTEYKLTLDYLASIGRTNVQEIADDFCERNIPNIQVAPNYLDCDSSKFMLVSRGVVVDEKIVAQRRETYSSQKEIRELRRSNFDVKDPVTTIREKLRNNTVGGYMFSCALEGHMPSDLIDEMTEAQLLMQKYGLRSD